MESGNKKIKKIKLSDGTVYSIFDEGALRLNEEGKLITGNIIVDNIIINSGLSIIAVDDKPVNETIDNVLIQDTNDNNKIKKRSTDQLLSDIGGISCKIENDTITFKIGKQQQ